MSLHRWLVALLCTVLLVGPVQAEEEWYEIELLVFARGDADSGQTESWPEYPGIPDSSLAYPIQSAQPETPPTGESPRYLSLPRNAQQLGGAENQLERTGGRLDPLLHIGWRQAVSDRDNAQWIYLESPSRIPDTGGYAETPRLEGTVRISLSRYLHIDLDLLLRNPTGMDSTTQAGYSSAPYRSYRMQDHRRMRSSELHYIDHPLMGVLVEIRPYEPPQPEPPVEAPIPLPNTTAPTSSPMAEPSGEPITPPQPE